MNTAQLSAFRAIAKSAIYPFTLHFTRLFTAGLLEGLTHDDTLGFCSEADASEWVSSVNAANARGKVDYKVVSFRVEVSQ